jgi:hypothetical protein
MGALDWIFGSNKTQSPREAQSAPPTPTTLPHPQAETDTKSVDQELARLYALRDPRNSCHKPLHLLQRVVVFLSGDAGNLSYFVAAVLQEFAESPHEAILKQARMDMISQSTVGAEIRQTGKVPDSALKVISFLDPTLIAKHMHGEVDICVTPVDDPVSGQSAAIFLFYNKG